MVEAVTRVGWPEVMDGLGVDKLVAGQSALEVLPPAFAAATFAAPCALLPSNAAVPTASAFAAALAAEYHFARTRFASSYNNDIFQHPLTSSSWLHNPAGYCLTSW
jgi:hypothetical protein